MADTEERCKHEMLLGECADCRGLKEPSPHDGLLIERFGVTARYKARCACCPDHKITPGDIIARAVEDSDTGRPPFKDFGWVCYEQCVPEITKPRGTEVTLT